MHFRLRVRDMMVFLVWALLFTIPSLSQRVNNILTLTIEFIVLLWLMHQKDKLSIFKNCGPVILFGLYIVAATAISVGFTTRLLTALVQGTKYVTFFCFSSVMVKRRYFENYIKLIFRFTLIAIVISDIIVFISGGQGIGGNEVLGNYFIGNKFTLTYTHMLLLGLSYYFIEKNVRYKKIVFTLLTVYCLMVARFSDCTTGMIGILTVWAIAMLDFKKNSLSTIIENKWVFIAVTCLVSFLIVGTDVLFNNPIINEFFTKYSHTSKILSGRIDMYKICLMYIPQRLWIGYGINCTIVEDLLTWGNPQNGLLKMLLDHGLIGTVLFFWLIVKSFSTNSKRVKNINHSKIVPFLAVVYALSICAMVELSFNTIFYFSMSVLFAINKYGSMLNDSEKPRIKIPH